MFEIDRYEFAAYTKLEYRKSLLGFEKKRWNGKAPLIVCRQVFQSWGKEWPYECHGYDTNKFSIAQVSNKTLFLSISFPGVLLVYWSEARL